MNMRNVHYKTISTISLLLIVFLAFTPTTFAAPLYATYYVTNSNSSGPGSLRQAILDANMSAGRYYIYFNIPESDPDYSPTLGVWFLNLTVVLPMLEDNNGVVIDGASQPGSHSDLPGIIIDGSNLPGGTELFTIISNGNTINQLGLIDSQGNSIEIDNGADYNIISNNQIFTSKGHGIMLHPLTNHNSIIGNKVCGHEGDGIFLDQAFYNFINGNTIGIQPTYILTVPGNNSNGINCQLCQSIDITENTISDNEKNGIRLNFGIDNRIEENMIGLSTNGIEDRGNGYDCQ